MTPEQIQKALTILTWVTFLPGSKDKRFAQNMGFLARHNPEQEITERQNHYLDQLLWKYRRQIPAKYVPATKPAALPPKQDCREKIREQANRLAVHEAGQLSFVEDLTV